MSEFIGDSGGKNLPISSASWSYTDDQTVSKYDHAWCLANFERKMGMKNGDNLHSGNFRVNFNGKPTDWNLLLYPSGDGEENTNYVSLYLRKANVTSEPIEVEAIFYIVNQRGEKENRFRLREVFKNKHETWGFAKFVNHSSIRLPSNKSFTVLCELSLLGDAVLSSGTNKTRVSKDECTNSHQVSLDMCSFLESGEFSDCIVRCGLYEYNCHKIILARRSPVFKAMFSNDMKENRESKVVINDLDQETVYEMLYYIYSGNVKNLKLKALNLLAAADKYAIGELKETCESHLQGNLTIENISDILIVAYLHNCLHLQRTALRFVTDNGEKVLKQTGFKDKLKMYPDIAIKMFEASIVK